MAPLELEEVPTPIVGGLDIHRKQLTFDYPGTSTGEVKRGQVARADRAHLRAWLARFAGREDVAFALEGCTGWRYVAEELAAAGIAAHLAEPADAAAARGRKRHAKTDKTDSHHLRELLAEGRLPECWIPPSRILECRALLETYHDLNMSSISGKTGAIGQTNYSAAKAGIVGLTKAAAKELAHHGVRVNAIQPGLIRTAMTEALPQKAWDQKMSEIPMQRAGAVSEIASVALFLASDLSSYMTGTVLEVTGGRFM